MNSFLLRSQHADQSLHSWDMRCPQLLECAEIPVTFKCCLDYFGQLIMSHERIMMVHCLQTSAGDREIDKQTVITSPLLRCSALLLPIILMNVSSSVPNLPSPAVYKSCGNRYIHTHRDTLCCDLNTQWQHWWPGIVPKQKRKLLFFLKLVLLFQKKSGFWAPLHNFDICHVQIKTKTNYRLLVCSIYSVIHFSWFWLLSILDLQLTVYLQQ